MQVKESCRTSPPTSDELSYSTRNELNDITFDFFGFHRLGTFN